MRESIRPAPGLYAAVRSFWGRVGFGGAPNLDFRIMVIFAVARGCQTPQVKPDGGWQPRAVFNSFEVISVGGIV